MEDIPISVPMLVTGQYCEYPLQDKLIKEGFYEQLFGAGIKAEEERKAKLAFR